MITKTLAVKGDNPKSPWTAEQVKLITSTVARGATPDELKLFLYTAGRTGLDPLTKQIHFVKRGEQMTIQTGIDGYRAIAERSGKLAGIDDAMYDSEDAEHPNKASVTIYKIVNSERVSYTASARWSEYCPMYAGKPAFMWTKMPYLMLAKCAEALALRKAFPNDLSGLYTNEEMAQASQDVNPKIHEITAKVANGQAPAITPDEYEQMSPEEKQALAEANRANGRRRYAQHKADAAKAKDTVLEDEEIPVVEADASYDPIASAHMDAINKE